MIKYSDVRGKLATKLLFAVTMLLAPSLDADRNSCLPPEFHFYGRRLDGFVYECIKQLGSHPGITPPCATMCPYNVTFEIPARDKPLLHVTAAHEGQVKSSLQYRAYVLSANCTSGILQVVWTGPAFALFLGHASKAATRQRLQNLCSATPNPMPCSCQ